jgi:3',5'-cyclic AMP phosphodiesterase CpdA
MMPEQVDRPVIVAQFSDLHITVAGRRNADGIDTAVGLSRCIAHLGALDVAPDLLVLSGDLADEGELLEYLRLRTMLAAVRIPVCLMPGNHDRRAPLRQAFADHAGLGVSGRMHYHRDIRGLRVIVLDSVIEGRESGDLDAAQLQWLEKLLHGEPAQPSMIFLHHPPVVTGFSRMDRVSVAPESVTRFGALIAGNAQVRGIFCGHVHRGVQAVWHGVPVSVCPSAAFQARLRLGRGRFEATPDEPPGYLLHYWDGRHLATHTITV